MFSVETISLVIAAYLLGSIPTAVWVGQAFYGIDVREYGSGNAGATNTFRVLGKKAGIPVLIIDVLKGMLGASLPLWFGLDYTEEKMVNFQLTLGVGALLGHIFPVYAGFRGGKGIATLLGIMLAIHPAATGMAAGVFLIVFLITKYVSLSSMSAAVSFPLIVILVFKSPIPSLTIFSLFIAILVLFTHQKNIERLLRREESKARIRLRRPSYESDDEDDDD